MLRYFIEIANTIILMLMLLMSDIFGWHDKLDPVMTVGYIFTAIVCVYYLIKHYKNCKKWDFISVAFWLIIDILGSLVSSGVLH